MIYINLIKIFRFTTIILLKYIERIHHTKLLKEFLEENTNRLKLVFLPPYSPNLNLIEPLWKWLKEKVVYNFFIHL
ncbi:transposase [Halonatronum saccharophilum]|uniref:transposase n=1 Tax=Halonatronum saccharophilum TaxID=150060 RepID=UPI000A02D825